MHFVEWAARAILVLLVILSVVSIGVIIDRFRFFKKGRWNADALDQIQGLDAKAVQDHAHLTQDQKNIILACKNAKNPNALERAFENGMIKLGHDQKKGLGLLGSLGATAPFIGLLGTVLGIIKAFGDLSLGDGNMEGVMFALAEALILTAVGLLVAIPAVLAYNAFRQKTKGQLDDWQWLKNTMLAQFD